MDIRPGWTGRLGRRTETLRQAYQAMLPKDPNSHLEDLTTKVDHLGGRSCRGRRYAIVADADPERRSMAGLLLSKAEFSVVECASAEAALAVLLQEAGRTISLATDHALAGERSGSVLARSVRKLWPTIHVALACDNAQRQLRIGDDGVAHLPWAWLALDLLTEAERGRAQVA